MTKSLRLLAFLMAGAVTLNAQITLPDTAGWNTPHSYPPQVSYGQLLGTVPPLRDLEPRQQPAADMRPGKMWHKRNYFKNNEFNNPNPAPANGDPLVGGAVERALSSGPQINLLQSFAGLNSGVTPPDPNGDIGKNHYIQTTNGNDGAIFRIWDKQGNSVYGPASTSTIWSQVGSSSFGDPVIQYDPGAERWLLMELKGGLGTNELLIAISDGSDPTGGWKAYTFQTLGFPDYPKLYIWPDAYIITVNELVNGVGNVCSGYALEKPALLAAAPEFKIYRYEMPNYLSIVFQPAIAADWEGGPPPPAGTPGTIFRVYDDAWNGGVDQLQYWQLTVDWQDVDQSHIDGPQTIYTAPFETRVCWTSMFDCIEQPDGNAPRITALENILMYRAPYRNFGDHESVVLNHITDASSQTGNGGDAQVRWYELRRSGAGPWTLFQQGTYAPDVATNRFMGTISMDAQGNIGLGYSVCSDHTYPGLRLTGRRASDPLNILPIEEFTLKAGGNSHFDDNRWGDYSSTVVDPEDGLTFWFTGEYQPANGNWGTWIGSFRIGRDTFDVTPEILTAPQSSAFLGNAEPVTVNVLNGGLNPATGVSVTLRFEGGTVVTDLVPGTIQPGESVAYTFSQTVAMPVPGKTYAFEIITTWPPDAFTENDTLRASVKKLTTNDASIAGKTNLPGLVCGTQQTVGLILRNTSGAPLQSAEIYWRLNTQAFQLYPWTGNLAPGGQDTVYVTLNGINNGLNGLRAYSKLPNGQDDQFKSNDTLIVKFFGNLDGTYLTLNSNTEFGILHWELRSQANQLLLFDDLPPGQSSVQVCSDDNTCYKIIVKSTTLAWQGNFRLLDIFDNLLAEFSYVSLEPDTVVFCTPERKTIDVGALKLLTPVSSSNLTAGEPVGIVVRNFGLTEQTDIQVAYRVNGGPWHTEPLGSALPAGATVTHVFGTTEDLSLQGGIYLFELSATVTGDQTTANDTTSAVVKSLEERDLAVQNVRITQGCNDVADVYASARLYNNGLSAITGFQLNYSVNGVAQTPLQVTSNLIPGASTEYSFAVPGSSFGQNSLSVDVTNINNAGEDADPKNDTASVHYALSPDGLAYSFYLQTDAKPAETTWELRDVNGALLRTGGPYTNPGASEYASWCLAAGTCYTFRLFDSGGDGMAGTASIVDPSGNTVWTLTDGAFGSELSFPFCIDMVGTHTPTPFSRTFVASPNPTKALLEVSVSARDAERVAYCEVFDAQGRFLQTARLVRWDNSLRGVVSLEPYPNGIYFLRIKGLDVPLATRVVKSAN